MREITTGKWGTEEEEEVRRRSGTKKGKENFQATHSSLEKCEQVVAGSCQKQFRKRKSVKAGTFHKLNKCFFSLHICSLIRQFDVYVISALISGSFLYNRVHTTCSDKNGCSDLCTFMMKVMVWSITWANVLHNSHPF